jgi:hypothetical protein
VTLDKYRDGGTKYVSVAPPDEHLDLETKLYINKDNVQEVIQKLQENNYIKPESAE